LGGEELVDLPLKPLGPQEFEELDEVGG
jgi:hypothetical protein